MAVLQSASLELEVGAFIYRVINCALEVFSSIEHVVKENAQVIYELEELRGKKFKYEQSKLSIDQSIQRLEAVKAKYHAQEERIRLLVEEIEREKAKLSSLM